MPSISFSTGVNLKGAGTAWVEKPNFYSQPTWLCFLKEPEALPSVSLLHVPIHLLLLALSSSLCPISFSEWPGSTSRSFYNSVTQQRFLPEQHDPNPWHQGSSYEPGLAGVWTVAWGLGPLQKHLCLWPGNQPRPLTPRMEGKVWETLSLQDLLSHRGRLSNGYDASATLKRNYLCACFFLRAAKTKRTGVVEVGGTGGQETETVMINTASQTAWLCWARVWGVLFYFSFLFANMLHETTVEHRYLLSLRGPSGKGREELRTLKRVWISHLGW